MDTVGPTALARDILGFAGAAILGWRVAGRDIAVAVPAVTLLLICLFGRGEGLRPMPWAWPLFEPGDVASWGLPVALAVVGVLLLPRLPSGDVRVGTDN